MQRTAPRRRRKLLVSVTKLFLGAFCAALFCLLAVYQALPQTTIHVPANQPTIQAGINAAHNGDTVLVAPGTYNENIDFKGKAITVTSGAKTYSDAATTIINGANDGPVVGLSTNEPATAVLNGFTIQGGHAVRGPGVVLSGGVVIDGSSPRISNNIIQQNIGCGILIHNAGASPILEGNDIRQNRAPQAGETTLSGYCYTSVAGTALDIENAGTVTVIGNIIEDNSTISPFMSVTDDAGSSSGIFIIPTNKVVLANNIVRNNQGYDPNGLSYYGFGSGVSDSLVMIQNLFYSDQSAPPTANSAIYIQGNVSAPPYPTLIEVNNTIYAGQSMVGTFPSGSTIENNIFDLPGTEPANPALACDNLAAPSPIAINNNDIFHAGQVVSEACTLGSGNLSVDPQFIDPSTDNFHTQRTSPVVAAGDINAPQIPTEDLDSRNRTVCGTIDMGVYEVHPQPPITLTASANPAPGQSSVTFTATVKGNCNTPTGTLTFLDGTTVLGTAPLNSGAVATFTTSFLFVGTHNITAAYPGDFNFDGNTSNVVTEIITGPPSTTVLNTVSPNQTRPLQAITMTATVSSAYTTPSGNVTFMANGAALATVPVAGNGTAYATISTLHAGTYAITAVYGGSTEYAASTSNAITETVLGTDTTTSLKASPNPVTPGQTLTLSAAVSGAQSGIPLTGVVTFEDGATTLGSANVGANGLASFSTSALLTGTHSIVAAYGGSSNYNASSSAPVNVVVTAIPTSIGLNASPNPAAVGQNVALVATVVSGLPGQVPTGSVTFSDQSGVLGTAPLTAGVAAFSTTSLPVGTHQLTATLNPAGSYAPASATVTELVTAYDFSVAVSSPSLSIPSGDYENLAVTVTPLGGFPGNVQLSCASVPVHAQCYFASGSTVALATGPQTVTLTINTSDVLEYGNKVGRLNSPAVSRSSHTLPILAGLLLPALLLPGFRRRPKHRLLLLLAMAGLLGAQGCSGKLPAKTPPGTYAITLTGSSATTSHSVPLPLTVTP